MIAFFSFRFFIHLVEGQPLPFACNYTFGHILQLLASTFLCGPKRQFKYVHGRERIDLFLILFLHLFRNMFDEKRRFTSITYLSRLVATLIVIFIPLPSGLKLGLLLLLMLTQFCASVWYTLSYIPYGRRTALRCLKHQLGIDEADYANVSTPSFQISG